jgi:hypothetical protein
MTATVVDTHLLLRMTYTALAAGIGVSVVFALAVYGVTRAGDLRREQRVTAASGFAVLGGVALVATVALIVYGLILLGRRY